MRNFAMAHINLNLCCLTWRVLLAHVMFPWYKMFLWSTAYAFGRFPETFIDQKSAGKKITNTSRHLVQSFYISEQTEWNNDSFLPHDSD